MGNKNTDYLYFNNQQLIFLNELLAENMGAGQWKTGVPPDEFIELHKRVCKLMVARNLPLSDDDY